MFFIVCTLFNGKLKASDALVWRAEACLQRMHQKSMKSARGRRKRKWIKKLASFDAII